MTSSALSALERLAGSLRRGLQAELLLTPKPGLVDLLDSGSHPDLSLSKMLCSVDLVGSYFDELAAALQAGAALPELVSLGRRAEASMRSRLGTNTHKGAIFLGGLLLVARARAAGDELGRLRRDVAKTAAEFFALQPLPPSHGENVRRSFGKGGIVGEARLGLPCLFDIALPAWEEARRLGLSREQGSYLVLARLMASVEDTTALHRCGAAGLRRLHEDGKGLEERILAGGDFYPWLRELNVEYRRLNLTMGGVADLLGLAFGLLDYGQTGACQAAAMAHAASAPGRR